MTRQRIGILLPSSNTVLEPLSATLLAGMAITAHFSRLGVIDVSLEPASRAQFEMQKMRQAAALLCDAQVDALVWGGTSSSWLGVDHDLAFCRSIQAETGIPTGSCVLEMNQQLNERNARNIALVTPYAEDVHQQIIGNYHTMGFSCVSSAFHGGSLSNGYADISAGEIARMVRAVADKKPDAILIMCTNVHGAAVAEHISHETGIPVIDSAAATLQAGLRFLGQ